VLVSAAVCPHPPLLLPGLTGAADVGAELRASCLVAVEEVLREGPEQVVVVGGAATTSTFDPRTPVDPSPYGGPAVSDPAVSDPAVSDPAVSDAATRGPRLPLSLLVGRTLLDASSWSGEVVLQGIAHDAAPEDCVTLGAELVAGRRTALLVLGDGSARRGPKAPGYVDDRAEAFDARVAAALAGGDAQALSALEPGTAAELLVAGRAAWQVLAGALGPGRATGRLLHADDPFGVLYLVATWRPVG
jgi:hypothetical protein